MRTQYVCENQSQPDFSTRAVHCSASKPQLAFNSSWAWTWHVSNFRQCYPRKSEKPAEIEVPWSPIVFSLFEASFSPRYVSIWSHHVLILVSVNCMCDLKLRLKGEASLLDTCILLASACSWCLLPEETWSNQVRKYITWFWNNEWTACDDFAHGRDFGHVEILKYEFYNLYFSMKDIYLEYQMTKFKGHTSK